MLLINPIAQKKVVKFKWKSINILFSYQLYDKGWLKWNRSLIQDNENAYKQYNQAFCERHKIDY